MKSAVLAFLVILALVLGLVVSPTAAAADQGSSMSVYVVPAITDEKILPTTSIAAQYLSSQISIVACPGEYESASFVIRANEAITSLTVTATDLTGTAGSIASTNVDIRVVKCWYQAGTESWNRKYSGPKALTSELLLKDDSLVKVSGGENYLKLASGQYVWISQEKNSTTFESPSIQNFGVKDSSTLQPVNISSGTNKQFWVTVEVPSGSSAGAYSGRIQLSTSAGLVGELQLGLEVLQIVLSKSYLSYGVTYFGVLQGTGTIGKSYKNLEQYRNEIEDLAAHGAVDSCVMQGFYPELGQVLAIRNELGMSNQTLFYQGLYNFLWGNGINTNLAAVQQKVADLVKFTAPYGVKEIYIYAKDEVDTAAQLKAEVPVWEAIHRGGAKVYAAGGDIYSQYFDIVGNVLDLYVWPYQLSSTQAAKWHSVGHKILSYANPATGPEKPATFRRNYGLLLWQKDYDGGSDMAYQWGYGSLWNDFDNAVYKDEVMAYPTMDGVIDTMQWEGWREGADDVRYLTTLLKTIKEAKAAGKDTSAAEKWLADLKASDLTTKDLGVVRSQMVSYILSLSGAPSADVTAPVITSIANSVTTSPSVTATVTWTTNERASSQVEYGKTSQLGLSTTVDASLLYSHVVTLTGLDANSTYYFRVKSKDASGNLATSGIQSLSTTVLVPSSEASLVGYWNLNENSGTIAYDKSTYGNNGTLKNGPQWTTGKFGSALNFDGIDDYVDCGTNASLGATNAITVEAWVKTSKAGWNTVATRLIGSTNGYWFGTGSSGKLYMFIYNNGTLRPCSTGYYITDGAWHHVVGVYDGTKMTCYVDGKAVYTKDWGSFMAIGATAGSSLYISSTGSDQFNGLIDEVRIWKRALSPEEVKASYSSNTSVPSLVPGDAADVTAPTDNPSPAGNGTTIVDAASQPPDVKSDDQANTVAEIPDLNPPSDPVSNPNQTETSATPPMALTVVLAGSIQPTRGNTNTVIITGANMGEATAVSFGPGVAVDSFTVDDPNQVTAQITIARNAEIGARDITITTPDGNQTFTGFFTVVKKPSNGLPSWAWVLIVLGVMALMSVAYVMQRRRWLVAQQVQPAFESHEENEGAPATRLTKGGSRDDIKRIDS